jgi:hypothetical protein
MCSREAAILFNLSFLTLIWSGLSAWFGYRRFQVAHLPGTCGGADPRACFGALLGASIAGLVKGVDPFVFFQDSAKLRHVVTAGLVFGVLFAIVTGLIAHLRNREYRAMTAHLEPRRARARPRASSPSPGSSSCSCRSSRISSSTRSGARSSLRRRARRRPRACWASSSASCVRRLRRYATR